MVDRAGARWPLTVAYVALAGVLLAFAAAAGLHMILILSIGAGFFLMGANYALYGVAASYYPRAMRGTGSGASIAIGRVGAIAGPALPGLLLASGATADRVFNLMAPAAAVAAVAVFLLGFYRAKGDD
jgi:AAHS family 3-hydroxyphenylpropionic acid transporter